MLSAEGVGAHNAMVPIELGPIYCQGQGDVFSLPNPAVWLYNRAEQSGRGVGMPVVKDRLICLRKREYSESSQVLVFLGRTSGKVSLLAKGSRRRRGGAGGGVDLLDILEAQFSYGREGLGVLREYLQERSWRAIRSSVQRWYCGLYLAEVVELGCVEQAETEEVFDLVINFLERLEGPGRPGAMLVEFQWVFLGHLGFGGQLERCVSCGGAVGGRGGYFSGSEGGLLCRDCESPVMDKISVGRAGIEFLAGRAGGAVGESCAFEMLNYHLREVLGKDLIAARYCRKIWSGGP